MIRDMGILHARVKGGRFIVDETTDLPDGTTVHLALVGDDDLDMTAEERAEDLASIDRGLAEMERGEGSTAAEVLERLRTV